MEAPEQTDPLPVENTPPEPPQFIQLVMQSLEARSIKPRCLGCDCIGWANFQIVPGPVAIQILGSSNLIPAACFICVKCGAMTTRNLGALGLTLTQEEKRIITPNQAAPKPLIVTG